MKLPLLLTLAACSLFSSCAGPGGFASDVFVSYTGNGVSVTSTKIVVVPGKEATTPTGAGYDLTTKKGFVAYADGHQEEFRITGAGFGGGFVALNLQGGGQVRYNTQTGELTTTGSSFSK